MFDTLVQKILALPDLNLNPFAMSEFVQRLSSLPIDTKEISPETFKESFTTDPDTLFTSTDFATINKFLNHFKNLIIEIENYLLLTRAGYKIEHKKKVLGGDEVIPLAIYYIADSCRSENNSGKLDKLKLDKLNRNLEFLYNTRQYYYFMTFLSATEYIYEQLNDGAVELENDAGDKIISYDFPKIFNEDEEFAPCRVVIDLLNQPDYYMQLFLLVKFQEICKNRMAHFFLEIYSTLKDKEVLTYHFDYTKMNPEEVRKNANGKIMHMLSDIQEGKEPFKSDATLTSAVRNYTSFLEFYNTVTRKDTTVFHRLLELSKKIEMCLPHIAGSSNDVAVSLGSDSRAYLKVPLTSRSSVINLFLAPPEEKVSLAQFMKLLAEKVFELEEEKEIRARKMLGQSNPAL